MISTLFPIYNKIHLQFKQRYIVKPFKICEILINN